MPGAELRTVRYELDASDVLRSVGAGWLAFARQNDAPELTEERVLGRPLWEFVQGEAVRALYRAVFERVRGGAQPAVLPVRCDGPRMRRYMQLVVSPRDEGALRLEGLLLREVPRSTLSLLDARTPRSDAELSVCSFCRRARMAGGEWLELEEAVVRLQLLAHVPAPHLRDAVCPHCRSEIAPMPLEERPG